MALIVSAYDLVVRVDALVRGLAAFRQVVPNSTFACDGTIAVASFMNASDREHFAVRLRDVPAEALARVDRRSTSLDAPWLERGHYSGVAAVWLRGAPPGPLVVPVRWRPGELLFGTWEEMKEHLEYLGVENNIEVFRDKRTGKKLYAGRTRPVVDRATVERAEQLRQEGSALLKPLLAKILRRVPLGFFEKRQSKKASALLEQVVALIPDEWSATWLLGMAARGRGDDREALEYFRRAHTANPTHRDLGREYAGQCFIVGETDEGIRISRHLHAQFPEDIALHSNLALALLLGGDLHEARAIALAAHERDRADPITKNLLDHIGKVIAGHVARPTRLP